ncbi:MAG: FAD-dependent thymidylate synthase [Synergistaceae bacterium]|nr:FAD-dependent thymidylate synthase [Synergistaceae bacterium]
MDVRLLTTPEHFEAMQHNAAYAMLTCHANTEKLRHEPSRSFIEKAIKAGHDSILEHITLTYEVNNLSRACLQELARHRHISLSVESTRHTLKKHINDESKPFYVPGNLQITLDGEKINPAEIMCIFLMQGARDSNISNDILKYYIPEFWPTNLVMTANVRELRHIVKLRTSPAALKEFQDLARKFVEVLPDDFKYLLEDCVHE